MRERPGWLRQFLRFRATQRRVFTRSDGYTENDLLHFAHDHLASAQVLFERSPSCYDSGAVLGHLGIELLLKALLLHRTEQFPATHSLGKLRRLLARTEPIEFTEEDRAILSRIDGFFSLRYPTPEGSETLGTEDLPALLNLSRAIVSAFPQALRNEFATQSQKGGRILMRKPVPPEGAV